MDGLDGARGQPGTVTPHSSRLETRWLADEPSTKHRRLSGSLLSADLSGFTALSERLASRGKEGSERLTAMVNGCFDALIRTAGLEGGDVLKFGGDALLVWFDGEDHPARAARAGARMQRAIGAARFSRAGLGMSVGAHTDDFDLFLIGPTDWRELVLAGRPVTTTVELEAAAGRGEVLVSPALAAYLPETLLGVRRDEGFALTLSEMRLPRRSATADASPPGPDQLPARIRADVEGLTGLGGEHRLATVVFAELEGTDARISELPELMAASLDSLLLATHECANRYRLRFLYTDVIADGIKLICTAGAPTSTGEDEEAALRFATDLIAGDLLDHLHIGVNRGRVFAGFLGGQTRHTYTVMGDPVNLAARLMAKAEPGQVVASDDVVRRSRATFRITPLAPFLVKGKTAPVTAHLVGPASGERRGQLLSVLPLVGRAQELAILHDGLVSATKGRGRVIEITGDAGIGKTRLLEAIADDPSVVVRVATECQPYDGLSPYASARTLLRRALGILDRTPPEEAGDQLRTIAARVAPEVLPLLPLIAAPLDAEVPSTPEADAIADQFRTARMHETVVTLLTAALPQTTLLIVEDVYYADDASLHLFRALAAGIGTRPWLLVVTRRPEGPGMVVRDGAGTVLKLVALAERETNELVVLASGGQALHPLEQHAVSSRAGGNPLFLLQLLQSAQEGASVEDLPESIERVVASRIDRLAPADRALLRQASVVGRVFHPAILDSLRAADSAPPVSAEQWDALADLVEPAGSHRWRFRHALFRDAAYEGLPFARRRRMHRAVGELLESGVAGEPNVGHLSEHFWLAGDAERTWRYSVAAGDRAWATFATAEAIAAYRRALGVRRRVAATEPVEIAEIAEALGDVLERVARYDEADDAYRTARRALPPDHGPVEVARLLRKRGELKERTGHYSDALRLYSLGTARLDGASEPEQREEGAALLVAAAGVRHRQGRHQDSAALARQVTESADGVSAQLVGHAESMLVIAATYRAGTDGPAHAARAVNLFRAIGDAHQMGKVLNNLGILHYFAGRWAEADDCYRQSAAEYSLAGDVSGRATLDNNLGELLSDQGHFEQARELFEGPRRTWGTASFPIGVALATANLGRLSEREGNWEGASVLLADSRQQFERLGASALLADVQSRQVELAVRRGRGGDVLEEIAIQLDNTALYPATRAGLIRCRGLALAQVARWPEALDVLSEAVRYAEGEQLGYEHALALEHLARLSAAVHDPSAPGYRTRADAALASLGVVLVPDVPLPGS